MARIASPGVFFFAVLNVKLEVSHLGVSGARGARVRFRLVVSNTADHAVDLYLRGREPTLEVEVARESGEVVWRNLEGVVIPAALQLVTLAAGERLELSADWDQRVNGKPAAAGSYVVSASLLAEEVQLLARPARLHL